MISAKLNFACILACLFGFVRVGDSSKQKCPEAGWIPYKDNKCIKIIQSDTVNGKNFHEASEICKGLLPFEELTGQSHPSSVLTIESEEEETFIQGLIPKGAKIWVNTKEISFVEKMLLKLQPSPLRDYFIGLRKCTKFNPDLISDSDSLKLERGHCTGSEQTTVCQNLQTLPLSDIQKYLFKRVVKDFKTLKSKLGKAEEEILRLESLNRDLSLSINVIQTENQVRDTRLQTLDKSTQDLKNKTEKMETELKKRKLQHGVETLRLNRKLEDINTRFEGQEERLVSLEHQVDLVKGSLAQTVKSTEFRSQMEDLENSIESQIHALNSTQSRLASEATAFQATMQAKGDIVDGNLVQMEIMISTASGVQADVAKLQVVVTTLERQDALFESEISNLKGKDKGFETAIEALKIHDMKTDSKVTGLEVRFASKIG